MSNFNKVVLMGRLTKDPESRYTQGGMAVVKCSIAVNRRYQDKATQEWVEKPTFVDVTIFGKRGEAFAKFHKRGDAAFFEGRLDLDSWEDKATGQKRSKLYVVADTWEFVGGKSEGGQQAQQSAPGKQKEWTVDGGGSFLGVDDTPF